MHIGGGRQEAHILISRTVGQVRGLQLVGLVIEVVRRDVVLASLCFRAFLVQLLGLFVG